MHAQVPVCVRLSLSLSVCGRISTRFSYLFWLMSTYPLATSNFNRPREFVAGGGGKRAGRAAAAARTRAGGGGGSELPACSTCYVQPRPRSPLCSSLCPLHTRPLQNVVCLAQLARTRIDVAHTFQDLCTWTHLQLEEFSFQARPATPPTPTLFTYSSLLVLGALGISCTDLRTCSHLPGTWLLKRNLLNICHWLFDFLLTWSHKH